MTWIEITFFIVLALVVAFGLFLDIESAICHTGGPPLFLALGFMFFLIFGALPSVFVSLNTPVTLAKEEPLKILSKVMADGKMIIVTDSVDKVVFSEYKDIVNIESGKGLVKRYYEKNVYYGMDSSWSKIEIK